MDKKLKIEKKKQIIITALKRCLEKNVYSQISLEDVAQEADLSKGGLRHYFKTREDLYIYLIEDFFNQIQKDHSLIMQGMDNDDKAFIATLFGIERFILDKNNIRIFMNIILYAFEDEKIMDILKKFISNHLKQYEDIIQEYRQKHEIKNSFDSQFVGRISQIILLCAGLFESIDPIKMDTPKLLKYVLKQIKQ